MKKKITVRVTKSMITVNHDGNHDQWACDPKKGQINMIAELKERGISPDLGSQITVGENAKGFWEAVTL